MYRKTLLVMLSSVLLLSACAPSVATNISAASEAVETAVSTNDICSSETALAGTLAQALDADTVKAMIESGKPDDTVCDAIGRFMEKNPDVTYAYLINRSGDKTQFLVNWEHTDEYWGDDFESYDTVDHAFAGECTQDSEPTTDKDGTVLTSYAPIIAGGEVIAVACVDVAVAPEEAADVIYKNAKVYTENEAEIARQNSVL